MAAQGIFVEEGRVMQRYVLSRGRDGSVAEMGTRVICAEGDEMALVYDRESGLAHKIGLREDMEKWADLLRGAFESVEKAIGGGAPRDGDIAVVAFVATEDSVSAAAECWARTGTANEFAREFGQEDGPAPSGPRH